MSNTRRQVVLLEKNKPRQERAKRTYEAILAAAAELLVEVGVERISTNLIAERAGITVPALYRYFPNKYSVLHALGAVVMDRQNAVAQDWFDRQLDKADPLQLLADVYGLLRLTYDVTLQQEAGLEISQSLRAVAPLQELRMESHKLVAGQLLAALTDLFGARYSETLEVPARISIDIGYSVVEMALEDNSIDAEAILREGARVIESYWRDILSGLEIEPGG